MASRVKYGIITIIGGFFFIVAIHFYRGTSGNIWFITHNKARLSDDFSRDYDVAVNTDYMTIPEDSVLKTISSHNLLRMYERYTSSQQMLCRNMQRTGGIYDGGKEVCVDKLVEPKKPCIVYSFGSFNNFDFEREVISLYGCDVKTFDPSMGSVKVENPPGCSFYPIGISGSNTVNSRGWRLKTFSNIIKMFNHTGKIIDILKMDVENAEWEAIPEMVNSGSLKHVKQFLVEFHFKSSNLFKQLAILRELHKAGFRIFNTEKNTACKCHIRLNGRNIAQLVEVAFVNTMFSTYSV